MASFDLLFVPPPRQPPMVGDSSSNQMESFKPWTFRFLDADLPRQHGMNFEASGFFRQWTEGRTFDMHVFSGGDTFDICGSKAYTHSDFSINLVEGDGRHIERRERAYVKTMVPAEEEMDPDEFNGYMELAETLTEYDYDLPGGLAVQTRIVSADRNTVWQYNGGEAPGIALNFSMVGGGIFTGKVDHALLSGYASEWQTAMRSIAAHRIADFSALPAYVRSSTTEGWNAVLANGVALVREEDIAPPDPSHYATTGLQAVYETETRANMPVVYEEENPAAIGNQIYGNGRASTELKGLISDKIWKDDHGIYNQVQDALAIVPWQPSPYGARIERSGYGQLSRGCFISVDGGTYRVTLVDFEDNVVGSVEVIAGTLAEYHFPLVATEEESFLTYFGMVEISTGPGTWAEIETDIAMAPGPGVRLIHMEKRRNGYRWGHPEFLPQDPAPSTPAGERRYALKIFRKNASP